MRRAIVATRKATAENAERAEPKLALRALRLLVGILALAAAAPASAQGLFAAAPDAPKISLRPFFEMSNEKFLATKTFDAIFGETSAQFWGGGLQVTVWGDRVYAEVGASRLLKKNAELVGQRVFLSDGKVFKLGIPLQSTLTPFEISGGYRFHVHPRVVPYAGAGFGSYHYTEESDFADSGENLDVTHRGGIFDAGVEVRAHRWVGVAVEAKYTHVPGILGSAGVSQQFAQDSSARAARERDLGGWAARLKVVVGR